MCPCHDPLVFGHHIAACRLTGVPAGGYNRAAERAARKLWADQWVTGLLGKYPLWIAP